MANQWRKRSGEAPEGVGEENASLQRAVSDLTLDKTILAKAALGKLLRSAHHRACVDHVATELGASERRACQALGQHRSRSEKSPKPQMMKRH